MSGASAFSDAAVSRDDAYALQRDPAQSDNSIAKKVGVSPTTVGKARAESNFHGGNKPRKEANGRAAIGTPMRRPGAAVDPRTGNEPRESKATRRARAAEWMRAQLQGGPEWPSPVMKRAKARGFTYRETLAALADVRGERNRAGQWVLGAGGSQRKGATS